MRRLAPCLCLAVLIACGPKETPEPTKIGERTTLVSPPKAPPKDPRGPFRHPDTEPPPPRAEAQVEAAALTAILTGAEASRAAGDPDAAIHELRRCANKVPQSAPCEALLGVLLTVHPNRRAEAGYYLGEAARSDDPELQGPVARELAEVLVSRTMFAEAIQVLERRLEREGTTTADLLLLAQALQGIAGREGEAADTLARAFALDPTQIQWLHDEAVLRGQVPGQARRAAALLKEYLARAHGREPEIAAKIEVRIRELEATADANDEPPWTGEARHEGTPPAPAAG